MTFTTPREEQVIADAVAFTAVRGVKSNRVRVDCTTMAEAERVAAEFGDGRTMIYAVDETGGAAHIKNA